MKFKITAIIAIIVILLACLNVIIAIIHRDYASAIWSFSTFCWAALYVLEVYNNN